MAPARQAATPPTHRPHRRRPRPLGIGQSSPIAEGLAPSSESITKHPWPSGTWLPPRSATTPSHRLDPPTRPCHGRVAWASSLVAGRRRWPGPTRRRGNVPGTGSRSRRLGHSVSNGGKGGSGGGGGQGGGQGGGSGDSGRVGEVGPVERLAPRHPEHFRRVEKLEYIDADLGRAQLKHDVFYLEAAHMGPVIAWCHGIAGPLILTGPPRRLGWDGEGPPAAGPGAVCWRMCSCSASNSGMVSWCAGWPRWPPARRRGGPGCAWAWPPRPWAPRSAARRPRTRPRPHPPSRGRAG